MEKTFHKVSMLRIVDKNNIVEDQYDITKLKIKYADPKIIHHCDVEFIGGVYALMTNPEYYYFMKVTQSRHVVVSIAQDEIRGIRDHLLNRCKREILNPMISALIYEELSNVANLKQRQIAEDLSITQGAISNKSRLINLPIVAQHALIKDQIKERHGRTLLQLRKIDNYEQVLSEVLTKVINEKLNVSATEDLVNEVLGKPVIKRESLNIKPKTESVISPESKIIVRQVEKELEESMKKINKYFPRLEVVLDEGVDKGDYIFLLRMKGINNG